MLLMNVATALSVPLRAAAKTVGALDAASAAGIVEAAGDIVLVMEADGTIIDFCASSTDVAISDADQWIGRSWHDVVTVESRGKVDDMLIAAARGLPKRWRQVNHPASGGDLPVRYWAVPTGRDGRVVAIGRDLRANAVLQQRLLQAQQALERDYLRLRNAESRYRSLFDRASEAILIVDAETRKVREANPAAARLLSVHQAPLGGRTLGSLFDPSVQDALIAYFGAVAVADQPPMAVALPAGRGSVMLSPSVFRQDQSTYFLIRVTGSDARDRAGDGDILDVMARMPDAFVLTDADLNIREANTAFVDLSHSASIERIRNTTLGAYLGRSAADLELVVAQVRDFGAARNVSTIVRTTDGGQEDVEVSAVSAPGNGGLCYGFCIRVVARRSRDLPPASRDMPRSVEQLTELVGRMSLKDIVRESTDLIERLCIEAALAHTADNRASAAEILGVSRQSLYSKLHRHGLGNLGSDDE